ncbi:MAG: TetR/AcrR family transcriptional regulator, partial [Mycobacteriales bacterium]
MRREPVSRRDRPAKPALSRDAIVDAALAVIEADGFDKLTMRRLAVDLDTAPASLYVYVASNTELHALILGRLLARLDLRWSGRGDWRARLRRLLVEYVDLLVEQPALARAALLTWPQGP